MQKAYELKDLVQRFKQSGLELTEEAAEKVLDAVFPWLSDSAKMSANQIDDLIEPFLGSVHKYVKNQWVDKIDGKAG